MKLPLAVCFLLLPVTLIVVLYLSATAKNSRMKIPILSFLGRTWRLLLVTVLANYLALWNHAFIWSDSGQRDEWGNIIWSPHTLADICGAIIYLPGLVTASWFAALLLLHLHFRDSIDRYIREGRFIAEWEALAPDLRLKLIFAAFIGLFIGTAIIGMGLAK